MTTAALRLARTRTVRWAAVVVVLGLVAFGVTRTRLDTTVGSFVPRNDSAYQALEQHDKVFGADPIVVVLHGTGQEGLLLDQAELYRLIELEGKLSKLPNVSVVYGPGTVLNQTAGALQDVLVQIAGARAEAQNLAVASAKSKGENKAQQTAAGNAAVAQIDDRYAPLLVKGMSMGLPTVSNPDFVGAVMFDNKGNPRSQWQFLVPDAKSATVLIRPKADLTQDQNAALVAAVRAAVDKSGLEISTPLITGVPVLTSAIADKAKAEIPRIGAVALLGVALVFFIAPWIRRRRFRLLPLASALLGTATVVGVFGLLEKDLTLGIVAFLPVLTGIGSDFPLYLFQATHRRRVLVAAAAAAIAFATLMFSPLPFVSEFGLALTLGVLATIGWALTLRGLFPSVGRADLDFPVQARRRLRIPFTSRVSRTVRRIETPRALLPSVAVLVAFAAVVGWVLLAWIPIQSSPQQLADGLPALAQVNQAEKTLGFSGELDVALKGPDVLSDAALQWSAQAEKAISQAGGSQMRPLLTFGQLLGFLGSNPTESEITAGAGLIPSYLLQAAVSPDHKTALSTYGIRLDDVAAQEKLIAKVKAALPPAPSGYTAEFVGIPAVAASGLDLMSSDRYLLNFGGIVAAALVVGIGMRSRREGFTVAAAALMSSGWIFLGSALLGVHLSPLTLPVGALITVTACEFATMMGEVNSERRRLTRRSVAIAATAGTIGYGVLAISGLAVLRDFGITLAAGVLSSYIAARIVVAVRLRFEPLLKPVPAPRQAQAEVSPIEQMELV